MAQNGDIASLLSEISQSLHREISEGFLRVNERLDLIETRLNRQGALIQTGSSGPPGWRPGPKQSID